MLRITQADSAAGAVRYLQNSLQLGDYYGSGERGIWRGLGAKLLGLEGVEVTTETFARLASNKLPDGSKLTVRDVENRRAGYDFCLSVPKSVSVYVAISEDPVVQRLIDESVQATMKVVESNVVTRDKRNGGDIDLKTGNLIWAQFHHTVTRPIDGFPDPHEHFHCWTVNATFCKETNRWQAIEFGEIKKDAPYYQVFDSDLAMRLEKNGYGIRRTERDFELAGVPERLIRVFSKRQEQVEKMAREQHRELAIAAAKVSERTGMAFEDAFAQEKSRLGAKTRSAKTAENLWGIERRVHWLKQMRLGERMALTVTAMKAAASQNVLDRYTAERLAIEHAFARVSMVRPLRLMGEILRKGIGVISRRDAEITVTMAQNEIVRIGDMVSTRRVIEEESAMIRVACDGRGKCMALGDHEPNLAHDWTFLDPMVASDDGQRKAVLHLLASRDMVMSVKARAGSGKSTMAKEAVTAIESLSGKKVFLFAPSSGAVEVLRKDGLPSETFQLLNASGKMQEAVKGQVIWIDEASFLGCKDMRWVLELARDNGCRVVLAGDTSQHHGVRRGDALRVLEEHGAITQVCLETNYRQTNQRLRSAINLLSRGKTTQGFDKLDEFGVVKEFKNPQERLETIARLHLEALEQGKTSLIVAPTHHECREIAKTVREAMREKGLLGEDQTVTRLAHLGWTDAQKSDPASYESGMVVQFHKRVSGGFKVSEQWQVVDNQQTPMPIGTILVERNGQQRRLPLHTSSRFEVYRPEQLSIDSGDTLRVTKNFQCNGVKFRNNSLYRVSGLTPEGIELDGCVVPRGLLHLDQGIAVTSHAAQGKTVDQVIVSAPIEAFAQVSREQFYVSMSRARVAMHLVTDSKQALRAAVTKSSARMSPLSEISGIPRQSYQRTPERYIAVERGRQDGR